MLSVVFALLVFGVSPVRHCAQTDCLACHGDKTMQDANGHSIAVDGKKFSASIHGSMKCNDCHADIKEYPHPDQIAPVECKTCHADEASALAGSVHADRRRIIPAPVATATRTRFFRRRIRDRRFIR